MNNREIFIDKLRQLSKEEMLERYIALLNTEKLTDYVADLESKLVEKEHSIGILNQHLTDKAIEIERLGEELAEKDKEIEELKGERLKFYTDDVRQTQVINGVHFDIEQLLVFSEYVEHEKWVISNKDKEIEELNKQLLYKDKEISVLKSQLCLSTISQSIDQDKISFAVEQLEQVKYYILTTQQDADYLVDKEQVNIHFFKDVIDNKIKKLTYQHEDKGE